MSTLLKETPPGIPLAGVKRNLWKTQQGPVSRSNFPIDGLVLYAPLWHPELSGTPFLSKDLNAHTCTVTGATWTSLGRSFNGTSDYVNCGSGASLNLTDAVTVEAWVKPAVANAPHTIVFKDDYTDNYALWLRSAVDEQFSFRVANTEGSWIRAGNYQANVWYHIVGTYNKDGGTNNVKLYVNGVVIGQMTGTGAITTNSDNLLIGYIGSSSWFKGLVGEVRIYNRALSLAEIQHNYNTTKWRYA